MYDVIVAVNEARNQGLSCWVACFGRIQNVLNLSVYIYTKCIYILYIILYTICYIYIYAYNFPSMDSTEYWDHLRPFFRGCRTLCAYDGYSTVGQEYSADSIASISCRHTHTLTFWIYITLASHAWCAGKYYMYMDCKLVAHNLPLNFPARIIPPGLPRTVPFFRESLRGFLSCKVCSIFFRSLIL